MSVPRQRTGEVGYQVRTIHPDEAYARALDGDVSQYSMHRNVVLGAAGSLGLRALSGDEYELPSVRQIADGLKIYPAPLAYVHAAAEKLDHYTGVYKRGKSHFLDAARTYVRRESGESFYEPPHLAPFMWASVLRRLSSLNRPPQEAFVRLGVKFIDSYRGMLRGSVAPSQLPYSFWATHGELTWGTREETFRKTVDILNRRELRSGLELEAQSLLAGLVHKEFRAFSFDQKPGRTKA